MKPRIIKLFFLRLQCLPMPSRGWRSTVCKWGGVSIQNPKKTFIGKEVEFDTNYPEDIVIEEGVTLTLRCIIVTHFVEIDDNQHRHYSRGKVIIKKNAYIGANTIICKPVTIGEGAIVGAFSVITKDIPPYEVWAGNPARFIRKRE
jgi:acetyltransferase-like isoleucine patch superfamily enzyme